MKHIVLITITALLFVSSYAQDCVGGQIYTHESYLYGRFEVAMRSAEGNGIVSSFFLYNWDGQCEWPENNNEIDIEMTGNKTTLQFTTHYPGPWYYSDTLDTGFNPHEAIHDYAIEWEPGIVRWFVDGELAWIQDEPFVADLIHPLRVMMNLWASTAPGWVGEWDPSIMPVQSEYEYVKIYTYTPGSGDYGTDNNFTLHWEDHFDTYDDTKWIKSLNHGFDGNYCRFKKSSIEFIEGKLFLQLEEETGVATTVPVTFSVNTATLDLDPGDQIHVAGNFNDWCGDCAPMVQDGDTWSTTLILEEGEYEYVFVKNFWEEIGQPDLGSECDHFICDEWANYGLYASDDDDILVLETYCWDECTSCAELEECLAPSDPYVWAAAPVGMKIDWSLVPGIDQYGVQYRVSGTGPWSLKKTSSPPVKVLGLTSGTTYDYRVVSKCPDGGLSFSEIQTYTLPFRTTSGWMNDLQVYPNPAKEQLQINGLTSTNVMVQLINVNGQLAGEYLLDDVAGAVTITVDDLVPGVYLLVVRDGDHRIHHNIIIQ